MKDFLKLDYEDNQNITYVCLFSTILLFSFNFKNIFDSNFFDLYKLPIFSVFLRASLIVGIVFVFSILQYLMKTRNFGTPLKDSFTKEQKELQEKSKEKRGNVFLGSLLNSLIGIFVVVFFNMYFSSRISIPQTRYRSVRRPQRLRSSLKSFSFL